MLGPREEDWKPHVPQRPGSSEARGRPEGEVAGSAQTAGSARSLRPRLQGGHWAPGSRPEAGAARTRQAGGGGEPGARDKLLKCLAVAPSAKPVLPKSPGLAA